MEFEPVPPRFRRLPYAWQAAGILGGSAAMAAASQVDLPLGPVPLTLQTLMLFLLTGAMGARAALSVALWLLAASLGAPVLSGGSSDVMGPTQGYLIGMVLAAAMSGRIAERAHRAAGLFTLFLYGHVIVLLFGFLGLLRTLSPQDAVTLGVLPFVISGILKSAIAAAVIYASAKALARKATA
jgi:biotin transport system substrate-specific component